MTNVLHTMLQKSTIEKINACRKVNGNPFTIVRVSRFENFRLKTIYIYIPILVPYEPVNIVAVVGIGHVSGIVANWNEHIDITELITYKFNLPSDYCTFILVYHRLLELQK